MSMTGQQMHLQLLNNIIIKEDAKKRWEGKIA